MPSIQVISQRIPLKNILKQKLKSAFNVFISGTMKDGVRNLQKNEIDIVLIDIQLSQIKNTDWIDTFTRTISQSKNEPGIILIVDPQWMNQPGFKDFKKAVRNFRIFWFNQEIYFNNDAFIQSLEMYLKDKINEQQALRMAALYSYTLNVISNSKSNSEGNKSFTLEDVPEPVSFLPVINTNQKFLLGLNQAIHENHITMLSGPDGLEQNNLVSYIHNQSNHINPLIDVDLNTIPEYYHEALIFGLNQKNLPGFKYIDNGLLESVKKGTLYIKNIESLKWEIQIRLMEMLKNGYFYREDLKINVKCKFIFSTHVNIEKYVEKGLFRQDLYFLLSPFLINIPTIQKRKKDLPLIIDNYKIWFEKKFKKSLQITPEAKLEIANQNYVGQFNQFYKYLFQLFSIANQIITPDEVRLVFQNSITVDQENPKMADEATQRISFIREASHNDNQLLFDNQTELFDIEYSLADIQKEYIKHIIMKNFNNISESARILGISRKTLYDKLKKYDIHLPLKSTG